MGNPQARVLAVCDPYASRQQEAKRIVDAKYGDGSCAPYRDFQEVLARADIDAVVIARQDHWHALIATPAAQARKDVDCEKPLGVSVRECQAIRNAVRRHQRIFQTGTQQRSEGFTHFRHGPVVLRLTASEHPICRGLPEQITFCDETYWPPTPPLDLIRVDVLATSMEADDATLNRASPQPMLWTCQTGRG